MKSKIERRKKRTRRRLDAVIVCAIAFHIFTGHLRAQTREDAPKKKSADADAAPAQTAKPKQAADGSRESQASPDATIRPETLIEFGTEAPGVKELIGSALALTTQDLTYTYGSDDPANGGMDCSGFIYYILRKYGYSDVPRDASGQYAWLRKAGLFRAVLSRNASSFELDELKPGDLLFWVGTYVTDHDPPVTHTMLYLGTEKETRNRVMVGSSDGRSYHGKSRWGVSVFDFKMPKPDPDHPGKQASFAGYARIPGLRGDNGVHAQGKTTAGDLREPTITKTPAVGAGADSSEIPATKPSASVHGSGAGDGE